MKKYIVVLNMCAIGLSDSVNKWMTEGYIPQAMVYKPNG